MILAIIRFAQITATGIFMLADKEPVTEGATGVEFTHSFPVEEQLYLVRVDLHLAGDDLDCGKRGAMVAVVPDGEIGVMRDQHTAFLDGVFAESADQPI